MISSLLRIDCDKLDWYLTTSNPHLSNSLIDFPLARIKRCLIYQYNYLYTYYVYTYISYIYMPYTHIYTYIHTMCHIYIYYVSYIYDRCIYIYISISYIIYIYTIYSFLSTVVRAHISFILWISQLSMPKCPGAKNQETHLL